MQTPRTVPEVSAHQHGIRRILIKYNTKAELIWKFSHVPAQSIVRQYLAKSLHEKALFRSQHFNLYAGKSNEVMKSQLIETTSKNSIYSHRLQKLNSIMDESTSLVYHSDDEYDSYHTVKINRRTKVILYTAVGLLGFITLWVFTMVLPSYYIPQAVSLKPINHISQLNVSFETGKGRKQVKRIIMIGDIHGHYDEFRQLLRRVEYNKKDDELLVLGDFVTKGPDSFKVLDYLIDHKIECILGNHEYYVLQYYANFHALDQPSFHLRETQPSNHIWINGAFNDDPEYLFAKKLQPHHVKYINHCSVIKELGMVPVGDGVAPGVAVHAGLRPDLKLSQQDPIDNLEMRSLIGPFYNETTSDPDAPFAKSWSKIYNSKHGKAPAEYVVYYGHDAGRGLKLKEYTKGLDSGCDKGGKLTAAVISSSKKKTKIRLEEEVVQVDC